MKHLALSLIFILTSCVKPLDGSAYRDMQKHCLSENRCWKLTKSAFFDVQGMECGEKLKYPPERYWSNGFDVGVNCNENDNPKPTDSTVHFTEEKEK